MAKLKIKHIDHDAVADAGKFEKEWTADEAYTVKHILVKRKDGKAWTDSEITVRIEGDPITLDHALCDTFGGDVLDALTIDEPLRKAQKYEHQGTNREGEQIDLAVELILEKA